MIVVTGAAGFIGSSMVSMLNSKGFSDLILVDDFGNQDKNKNLKYKTFYTKIHRSDFPNWFKENHKQVEFVFHLGARTDTTEKNADIFKELNYEYSKVIWNICAEHNIPLIYASSAATYGNGEHGFSDDHNLLEHLKPLNLYAKSKHDFDLFVIKQSCAPSFWAGIKFFNVYGPNEYHKKRMASVVYHAYNQINELKKLRLFRSHRSDFSDGMQKRDFIYIKDVVEVLFYMMIVKPTSGIYNLGTGQASTFIDLAYAIFDALNIDYSVEFIDIPEDIRDSYQYFTQADITKLREAGYNKSFTSIRDGVYDYVHTYLRNNEYY